jgi:hypothetical protein
MTSSRSTTVRIVSKLASQVSFAEQKRGVLNVETVLSRFQTLDIVINFDSIGRFLESDCTGDGGIAAKNCNCFDLFLALVDLVNC